MSDGGSYTFTVAHMSDKEMVFHFDKKNPN